MKCDTVNSGEKSSLSSIGTVGYDGSCLKGYKHLVVMGLDSRHVILTASLHFSNTPSFSFFVDFFNTLKLSIESVAWTSSFFVTLGL